MRNKLDEEILPNQPQPFPLTATLTTLLTLKATCIRLGLHIVVISLNLLYNSRFLGKEAHLASHVLVQR